MPVSIEGGDHRAIAASKGPGYVRFDRPTDRKPDVYIPAQPYEEYFSEGGAHSVRHLGEGSRIREKMNAEEWAILEHERVRS